MYLGHFDINLGNSGLACRHKFLKVFGCLSLSRPFVYNSITRFVVPYAKAATRECISAEIKIIFITLMMDYFAYLIANKATAAKTVKIRKTYINEDPSQVSFQR